MKMPGTLLSLTLLFCLVVGGAPGSAAHPALAQSGIGYSIPWWTVDGGGNEMTGSTGSRTYTLAGTAGQPDAGFLARDSLLLVGGFWSGGGLAGARHQLYLPLVRRARP